MWRMDRVESIIRLSVDLALKCKCLILRNEKEEEETVTSNGCIFNFKRSFVRLLLSLLVSHCGPVPNLDTSLTFIHLFI